MSMVTRCPHCATAFRITSGALKAHQGLVRCGNCSEVFNAFDSLSTLHDAPARSLPEVEISELPPEEPVSLPVAGPVEGIVEAPVEVHQPIELAPHLEISPQEETLPEEQIREAAAEPVIEELFVGERPPRFRWLWISGSMLLVMSILAQSLYYWRMELNLALPGLKPALDAYCAMLDCAIPLPRKTDLIGIESSSLQAEQQRVGVLDLHASIRNSAPFAQEYPLIELTLTDAQDAPLARKIFRPRDYLPADSAIGEGVPANDAVSVSLDFDTGSLLPSGYRLYLFYP